MGRLVNFFRGTVEVSVSGAFPERLINLCAQRNLQFWGLEWQDEHCLKLTVRYKDFPALRIAAERVQCTAEKNAALGMPIFLLRFRHRYAFMIGMLLTVLAISVFSRFVLTVEVSGNETVSAAEIISELRRLGLKPGVYGPNVDETQMAQLALLNLNDLAWMGINIYGTRAEVSVREVVQSPELNLGDGYSDLIATADGMIVRLNVLEGEPLVTEGDIVAVGDILIRGNIVLPAPEYSGAEPQFMQAHAQGIAVARTWRTLTATMPLSAQVKQYTGEQSSNWSLTLLSKRVDFSGKSSILPYGCDRICVVHQLTLPGGRDLPVFLTQEVRKSYRTEQYSIDEAAAQSMLERSLLERLNALVGEEGQIIHTEYTARLADGRLTVTLTAECQEDIGRQVFYKQERLLPPG